MPRILNRSLSLLLFIAAGCTYNPVCYDPVTGFRKGGGVDIACGGPLDPWMLKCGRETCCDKACRGFADFCSQAFCGSQACPPPAYPAPICPPNVCPPPYEGPVHSPLMSLPELPATPPMMGAAPVSTFADPCPSCGPVSSTSWHSQPPGGIPISEAGVPVPAEMGYPAGPPEYSAAPPNYSIPPNYAAPPNYPAGPPEYSAAPPNYPTTPPEYSAAPPNYPTAPPQHPTSPQHYPAAPHNHPESHVRNYPELFESPPPAPPAGAAPNEDPFKMPKPIPESEIPPSPDQLPPNSEMMDTPPKAPSPHPNAAPMPRNRPKEQTSPQNPSPKSSMPMGQDAAWHSQPRMSAPQVLPTSMPTRGRGPAGGTLQDSRRQQFVPVRR